MTEPQAPQPEAAPMPDNPLAGAVCSVAEARGYVAFGAGVYRVCQTVEPGLVVTFRRPGEEDRAVSERAEAPDLTPIPPEDMIVRLQFTSAAGLDSLEDHLREIRAEHWPETAGGQSAKQWLDQRKGAASKEWMAGWDACRAAGQAFQAPEGAPKLDDIEQYRMQMAGISTAAFGYWKEGDGIHPDYDTVPLRDVAKLYAKYDTLYKAAAKIADMDPQGQRADDLGRAARTASDALSSVRSAATNAALAATPSPAEGYPAMPAGWRLVEKKTHYQLNCLATNTVVATLCGPDAEENATIIARALESSKVQPKKTEFPEPHFVDQATGDSAYSADQMHAFAAKRFADGVALGVEQMTVDLDAAQAEVARLKAQAPAPAPTPGPAAVTALVADAKKAVEELTELALNNEAYSIADYQRESRKHGEAFEFALNNLATFATQVQATPAPAVGDAE